MYMDVCREYARSLINNLSLLSGLVVVPTNSELRSICHRLNRLQKRGMSLDEIQMKRFIHGHGHLNDDPDFKALKVIIAGLQVRIQAQDTKRSA